MELQLTTLLPIQTMKKTYSTLDEHYAQSMSNLTVDDKIEYLESIIDKNQNIISTSGSFLPKLKKLLFVEIVEAAQKEIRSLQEKKNMNNSSFKSQS